MSIPVLVRSVGPEPSAGYYTQWTTFVPGYPKFKNDDTGITQAFYAPDGVTLTAYRAHYLYFTGQTGEIVDRTVEFNVGLIPGVGQYYDIPVTAYDPGSTGFSPDAGSSSGTAQPSGPARLDITVSESFALSTGDAKVTDWRSPRSVRQLGSGTEAWVNKDGAKVHGDGVAASKALEASDAYKLVGQDFGFALPKPAVVLGAEVEVLRAGTSLSAEKVELVLGGKSISVGSPWDIESATKDGAHFLDFSAQGSGAKGIVFADSTTLLVRVSTAGNDALLRYDLSTPWEITTATLGNVLDTGDSSEYGCIIGGGKYYSISGSLIFQYAVSGDFISLSYEAFKNVNAQTVSPADVAFSQDGNRMFVLEGPDIGFSRVYQYNLSTAFDVSTATYSGLSLYGGSSGVGAMLRFKPDGLALYTLKGTGATSVDIRQWDLPSAYSLSGATLAAAADLGSATATGMDFSSDGNFLFVADNDAKKVYRYAMQAASSEIVGGHLYDEGYTFQDGGVYSHTLGELFAGIGSPPPGQTQRALVKGGIDAMAGLTLSYADINNISFGLAYTGRGSGLVAVDSVRMRIHYRADPTTDTLPAKRSAGLAGVAESPSGVKVAVGVDGKILRKPANNPTWAPVSSGTTVSLNAVEWVGDRFIAVGMFGMALDGGSDGSTWTRIDTGAVSSLWAIKRVPNSLRAVAVGNDDYSFERGRNGGWTT